MSTVKSKISKSIKLIKDQYQLDEHPWYLGFSGGKDSVALFAAVYSAIIGVVSPRKPIYLIYCNTGVEIPVVEEYVLNTLVCIRQQAKDDNLPIYTKIVTPRSEDSFFVKVVGKGYPPPTNKFRWCTDRLRVGPVRRAMQTFTGKSSSLMLLGTRWEESPERTRTLTRFQVESSQYHFIQEGNPNTMIFSPLVFLSTRDIWSYLQSEHLPTCLDVKQLIGFYRSANGPSCSGNCSECTTCVGGRFGCWTCTVVRKDRAVTNMVRDGYPELAPLLDFRNWLVSIRDIPHLRRKLRRNGSMGPGPFRVSTRRTILTRLKMAQQQTAWSLLSTEEEKIIKEYWARDTC